MVHGPSPTAGELAELERQPAMRVDVAPSLAESAVEVLERPGRAKIGAGGVAEVEPPAVGSRETGRRGDKNKEREDGCVCLSKPISCSTSCVAIHWRERNGRVRENARATAKREGVGGGKGRRKR